MWCILSRLNLWSLCLLVSVDKSRGLFVTTRKASQQSVEPPSSSLITRVRMRRHSCSENRSGRAGRDSRRSEHAAAQRHRLFPPHPGPNRDPDIKGRWSETMKLQVRCQLPFETKHSPNPGKTQLVPGIRTNKEELKGEWQRRRGRRSGGGGFTGRVDNLASV